MTNGTMFSVASTMMKHVVDENYDMAIKVCMKILEELENRKEGIYEVKTGS